MKTWIETMLCAAICAVGLLGPVPAAPQSIVSSGESFVDVRLVAGRAEPGGVRMAGLVLVVKPDWKTYWRSPGAAGIPPRFDWSRSRNLAAVEVFWPRPRLFESFGLTSVGYAGQVVFPLRLTPERPGLAIEVGLDLALGVCRDICVLEEVHIEVRIEPDAPDSGAALVAAAEATVPRSGAEMGLREASCRISGTGPKRRFEATLEFAAALENPVVVLEGPDLAWFTGVETIAEPGGERGGVRLNVSAGLSLLDESVWIDRSQIRMTVLAGDFAADIQGCRAPEGAPGISR